MHRCGDRAGGARQPRAPGGSSSPPSGSFYAGDIADGALIDRIFAEHPDIAAVVHAAALIVVPESVAAAAALLPGERLQVGRVHRPRRCATAAPGTCSARRRRSTAPATTSPSTSGSRDGAPLSPYARTKAVMEWVLEDTAAATGLRAISLRYFNPIGADPKMRTGLQIAKPTHVLGKLITALEEDVRVRHHRHRLADPRRLRHPRLHPRVGPGAGARAGAAAASTRCCRPTASGRTR